MSYSYGAQQHHAPPGGQHGQLGQMPHPMQQMQHIQGHMHMNGPPQGPPPGPHYGGHHQQQHQDPFSANAAAAYNYMHFSSENDLMAVFNQKYNHSLGGIQGQELFEILNQHEQIRRTYGISWSLELCKIMLAMLDRDKNGLMRWEEFRELMGCLVHWHQTFSVCDQDRSGYIEAHELHNVIFNKFKYRLAQPTMTTVLKRYARALPDGKCIIAFDDFVALCVRLRAYSEAFRARDRQTHGGAETGGATFGYDDFLQCVLCL